MTALRSGRVRLTALLGVLLLAAVLVVAATTHGPQVRRVASLAAGTAPGVREVALTVPQRPAAPPPRVPHAAVAPAAPTGFEISGPAFDIKADVCAMANVRPLDPPGNQYHTVCWVREGFGVPPGSDSGGTSYILGHSWAEAPLVLTPLSVTVMNNVDMGAPQLVGSIPTYPTTVLDGYRLVLTTPTGVLTYVVDDAYAVAKSQAANVGPLMDATTPNRVTIITCGVHDGRDVDVNIIVDATLYSSQAA